MEEVAVGECDILVLSLPVAPLALEGFMSAQRYWFRLIMINER